MSSLKSNAIKEYISQIDFKNDDWSIHQMSQDMKKFLGETPAVDISYKKEYLEYFIALLDISSNPMYGFPIKVQYYIGMSFL